MLELCGIYLIEAIFLAFVLLNLDFVLTARLVAVFLGVLFEIEDVSFSLSFMSPLSLSKLSSSSEKHSLAALSSS